MNKPTETPAQPGVYLQLFNTRQSPAIELPPNGPVFGPYQFVHTTCGRLIRMGLEGTGRTTQDLEVDDGLIYYAGQLYGNWSVFTEPLSEDHQKRLIPYNPVHSDVDLL